MSYPQQQPFYPYPPMAIPTNTSAVVSLTFSLIGAVLAVLSLAVTPLWGLVFICAVIGVIAGHIAKRDIKRTGEGGNGMAVAGLILGYLGVIPGVIMFILLIVGMVAAV